MPMVMKPMGESGPEGVLVIVITGPQHLLTGHCPCEDRNWWTCGSSEMVPTCCAWGLRRSLLLRVQWLRDCGHGNTAQSPPCWSPCRLWRQDNGRSSGSLLYQYHAACAPLHFTSPQASTTRAKVCFLTNSHAARSLETDLASVSCGQGQPPPSQVSILLQTLGVTHRQELLQN